MAANQRARLYKILPYELFVYQTSKKKAKKHFEEKTGLKASKVTWLRLKKIKLPLTELIKSN